MKRQGTVLFTYTIIVIVSIFFLQGQKTAFAAVPQPCKNCNTWKQVPSPTISTYNNRLNGVAAISTKDAWAVGSYTNQAIHRTLTLIEHWNGKRWNVVASPNVKGSTSNTLVDVAAISTKKRM